MIPHHVEIIIFLTISILVGGLVGWLIAYFLDYYDPESLYIHLTTKMIYVDFKPNYYLRLKRHYYFRGLLSIDDNIELPNARIIPIMITNTSTTITINVLMFVELDNQIYAATADIGVWYKYFSN